MIFFAVKSHLQMSKSKEKGGCLEKEIAQMYNRINRLPLQIFFSLINRSVFSQITKSIGVFLIWVN